MLRYRIDDSAGIVYIEGNQAGVADLSTLLDSVRADPTYRPGFGFLRDRRGMSPPASSILRRNAAAFRDFLRTIASPWAWVINDPANYGMARMAGLLVEGSPGEVAIFDQPEAAELWLMSRRAVAKEA